MAMGEGQEAACWRAPLDELVLGCIAGAGRMSAASPPLLRAENLVKHFPIRQHLFGGQTAVVHAVDGVNFELRSGDTMALVGESGCGKSTVGRLVLRLLDATSGKVWFDGEDLMALPQPALRAKRRELQMIFQDPYSSLNPRMTVEQTLAEPLALHGLARGRHRERAAELMDLVGPGAAVPAALSARVFRRPAAAHRHRPRAGGGAAADRVRRAGVGAGRVDPGADRQPAAGPAAPPGPGLRLHRARPGGGQAHRLACGRDVPGAHRRVRRQAQPVRERRAIPTRRPCCRRSRCPSRAPSASVSCCRATCPTRSRRRRAAASAPAARMRASAAARRCRPCGPTAAIRWPAISGKRSRRRPASRPPAAR